MMKAMRFTGRLSAVAPRAMAVAMLGALCTGVALTSGCTLEPPGPSPIYSRLPAAQSGISTGPQSLSPDERARYDAIDRQVMADQDRAIAAEAAAEAWSRYAAPPVTFSGSYYSGGWGHGWGGGIGYGYPGWGWGW
jgi:hypothetical protein